MIYSSWRHTEQGRGPRRNICYINSPFTYTPTSFLVSAKKYFFKPSLAQTLCVSIKAPAPRGQPPGPSCRLGGLQMGGFFFPDRGPDFKYLHHNKCLENKSFLCMGTVCSGGPIKSQIDFLGQAHQRVALRRFSAPIKNRPTTAETQAAPWESWSESPSFLRPGRRSPLGTK